MTRLALHWQILIGMIAGAAIGVGLNLSLGERRTAIPAEDLPKSFTSVQIYDSSNLIEIDVVAEDGSQRRLAVDGTRVGQEGVFASPELLAEEEPAVYAVFVDHGRSWARRIGEMSQRLGQLFLRMLRMVAIPLIVTSLVTGVMGLGHASRLACMFGRTVLYYVTTSLLAIVTGLLMVNLIRPGLHGDLNFGRGEAPDVGGKLGEVLFRQVETMIPPNPIAALAEGNFLSIICFSLAFAVFAILVGGRTADRLRDLFSDAFEVMMAMTMAIIKLAPVGVFFLMLFATATQGPAVFRSLALYMLAVLCALAVHALITLPVILKFVVRRNPAEVCPGDESRIADRFQLGIQQRNATVDTRLRRGSRRHQQSSQLVRIATGRHGQHGRYGFI